MKILLVSSKFNPEYSGSGLRAEKTFQYFHSEYNIDYDVLVNSIEFRGNKKYSLNGKKIYRISFLMNSTTNIVVLRKLQQFLKMLWEFYFTWIFIKKRIKKYDLLHTFGNSWSVGFLTWYFNRFKKPIVRELCNDMETPFYPIQFERSMEKIFKNKNTLIVVISENLEKMAIRNQAKHIWLRPNPVDSNIFYINYARKFQFREKHTTFKEDEIVLCQVATFQKRKNQLFSLKLINELPSNVKLLMAGPIGDKDYVRSLYKYINDNDLNSRVEIAEGFIKNIEEYMILSDLFLFPSLSEGLGTPVLESQMCGVPVLANLIPGVTDTMIHDGLGGFAVPLSLSKWKQKVLESLEIPKESLKKNAIKISKRASKDLILQQYIQKYRILLHD